MAPMLAIARLTMKGAFRVKAFVMLLAFLVLVVIALPLTVKGDGSVRGHVQILLSYSLGISYAILCLATMWLACDSLCRDVDDYHIQLVATKPVPRWQIWAGKWVGIMALDVILLAMIGLVTYALLLWTTRPGQLTSHEHRELMSEVLVARARLKPVMPDVRAQVEQEYQKRKEEKSIPADLSAQQFRDRLRHDILNQRFTAHQFQTVRWEFEGIRVPKDKDARVYLRFKHFVSLRPPNEQVFGVWGFGDPQSPNRHEEAVAFRPDSFHEIHAPAQAVESDGKLIVEYTNAEEFPTSVQFPLQDGVEVLYRVGSFGGNFMRTLLLLLVPLGLLTAIALWAGSYLTFPVAVFVSMSYLYLVLLSSPLEVLVKDRRVIQVMRSEKAQKKGDSKLMKLLDNTARQVIRGGLYLTASVRKDNPVGDLVVGRVVPWTKVGSVLLNVLLIQGGAFTLLGMYLLTRRELAVLQR